MLNHIRIVLIHTSHPGNIGSVARAMKTMGLQKLYLVSPQQYPHDKAKEMASGAGDILKQAIVMEKLEDAISDCSLIIGTSARLRRIQWPLYSPREMANHVKNEHPSRQIALLFGREQTGLTNDELAHCHIHIQIPSNPDYPSLNIASAVQVLAYELRLALLDLPSQMEDRDYRLATSEEMERFYVHLHEVLVDLNFLKMNAPRKLMMRLRRLFCRSRLDIMEINILRGLLSAVQGVIEKDRKCHP